MPKRVSRKPNARDTKYLPEFLDVPVSIPGGELRIFACAKYVSGGLITEAAKKQLTKIDAEGYKTISFAFAEDFEGQPIEVYIFSRKSKSLSNPQARIKKQADKAVKANLRAGRTPVLDNLGNIAGWEG